MRAVFVFCEGRHDVLFVQRSLGALRDCEFLTGPIQDLPTPLGSAPGGEIKSLILQTYLSRPIEESRIGPAAALPPFPVFDAVLRAPNQQLFVLVRCSGDTQHQALITLLSKLDITLTTFPTGRWDIEQYAAAFLYDADEVGVQGRVTKFRESFKRHFGALQNLQAGRWTQTDSVPVGCFIFHHPSSGTGTLEGHIAPLVKAEWPARWQAAVEFIDENTREGDRVYGREAERSKALITATGQFDFPGDPMSSVLDRLGLPRDCFCSQVCQDLVEFLTGVPWPQSPDHRGA